MALVVLFMLMAAMFRSLRDSAFVMATLPMAVLGGVLGLRVLDLVAGQTLDLLSMIGFIMLLGMVINNAILLVAQTREAQAAGAGLDAALQQALDQRLRPILIGALTGVLGALPMAINPGPGRGDLPRPGRGVGRRRRPEPAVPGGADPGAAATGRLAAPDRHAIDDVGATAPLPQASP